MILSYESRFAFQIQANNPQLSYPDHFQRFYRALYHRHVPIDIVAPTADLSTYKLVVAPALHVVSDAATENLKHFVETGGVLIVTQRSGVKDEANAVVNQRLPGLLADLCGIEVDEYDSLSADMHNGLEFALPELASCPPISVSTWCDVLKPKGATVVARYTQNCYAGKPAITLNRFGQPNGRRQGQVVYVGALGDDRLYEALAGWLLNLAGVRPILTAMGGVEVAERWQGNQRLLFVLNHTDRKQEVTLEGRFTDLLDGSLTFEGTVTVSPRDILVLLDKGRD